MSASSNDVYRVAGMSCDHCKSSVLKELKSVADVSYFDLDLETGQLLVEKNAGVSVEQIRSAVEIAGYELAEDM